MTEGSLFQPDDIKSPHDDSPLAERMRPRVFEEFVGQHDLLDRGQPLREAIEQDALQSIILWGPPGTGKTTLARLIAKTSHSHFVAFSAVLSGTTQITAVMSEAEANRQHLGRRTTIFVDEIHRFNKSQQDSFLPYVENGIINLIATTTENPNFEINSSLLSRVVILELFPLDIANLNKILRIPVGTSS